jgi:subtilisin family serine protease
MARPQPKPSVQFEEIIGETKFTGQLIVRILTREEARAQGLSDRDYDDVRARALSQIYANSSAVTYDEKLNYHIIKVPNSKTENVLANEFLATGDFSWVEPNYIIENAKDSVDVFEYDMDGGFPGDGPGGDADSWPPSTCLSSHNDPFFTQQWHHAWTRSCDLWDITPGLPDIKVCVIDTGVSTTHPDLSGPRRSPAIDIRWTDPDTGYPGPPSEQRPPGWTWPPVNSPGRVEGNLMSGLRVEDTDGHGTHVMGIITANANNGIGVVGIAKNVSHISFNVFIGGSVVLSDLYNGIRHAADIGCKVINTSIRLRPDGLQGRSAAAAYAKSRGSLLFQSAGNRGGDVNDPEHFRNEQYLYQNSSFVMIGSLTYCPAGPGPGNQLRRANYSAYGPGVSMWITGGGLPSPSCGHNVPGSACSGPDRVCILSTYTGSSYAWISGTSQATPTAAAVAAIIWSKNKNLTPDQVYDLMSNNSDTITVVGTDNVSRQVKSINALRALQNTPSPCEWEFDRYTQQAFVGDSSSGVWPPPENVLKVAGWGAEIALGFRRSDRKLIAWGRGAGGTSVPQDFALGPEVEECAAPPKTFCSYDHCFYTKRSVPSGSTPYAYIGASDRGQIPAGEPVLGLGAIADGLSIWATRCDTSVGSSFPECSLAQDDLLSCSYAVTNTPQPPAFSAEIATNRNGDRVAYAKSCCNGVEVECDVPFYPNFANAAEQGCASWEGMYTCMQNGIQTWLWKPVIKSCDLVSNGRCSAPSQSECAAPCESCCELCFAVGTRVLLPNGQTKAVEELNDGDVIASVSFRNNIPNPTYTNLVDGWQSSPDDIYLGSARVTSAQLGYEQGRTSIGNILTVSPDHPVLVMRKDGMCAFVSATLLPDHARLLKPDGTTVDGGLVNTSDRTLVTVSINMDGATCLVANGVVCHVGSRAGSGTEYPDSGFSINPTQLDISSYTSSSGGVGQKHAHVFYADADGSEVEVTQLSEGNLNDSMMGVSAGDGMQPGCSEPCECMPACLPICSDGSTIYLESYAAMPCCGLDGVGSALAESSLSVDNSWLMQSIRVNNGDSSGTFVVSRRVQSLCSSGAHVLALPMSDGMGAGHAKMSESVVLNGEMLFTLHKSGGNGVTLFAFDGSSYRHLANSMSVDVGTVLESSILPAYGSGVSVYELRSANSIKSLWAWGQDGDTQDLPRQIFGQLNNSVSNFAVEHGIGAPNMICFGGDGILQVFGFYGDDPSQMPWRMAFADPTNGYGGRVSIGGHRWVPYGARDSESILVAAVPLDGSSDVWIFRLGRGGDGVVMTPSSRPIPKPSGAGSVQASGIQGRFLVCSGGHPYSYEYNSSDRSVVESPICNSNSGAISCSKSHDLSCIAVDDIERCPSCGDDGSPCNRGGIFIKSCGTICTGKQLVVSCSM